MWLIKAFVVSLSCTVRREGATQMSGQQRRARRGPWRPREDWKDEHTGLVLLINWLAVR